LLRRAGQAGMSLMALASALMILGCSTVPIELVETHAAMDAKVTIRVVAPSDKAARVAADAAWKEMDLCIRLFDAGRKPSEAWLKNDPHARVDPHQMPSDVWRINDTAGRLYSIEVSPVTASCLEVCTDAYKSTEGAFDPSVGPLLELWRQAENRGRPPTQDEVVKARAAVGFKNVEIVIASVMKPPEEVRRVSPDMPPPEAGELSKVTRTVGIHEGMSLDLGGIVKGYVAGRMTTRMQQAGAKAGLVAFGGQTATFGEQPRRFMRHVQGKPQEEVTRKGRDRRWAVGVQDPRFPDDPAKTYTTLRLQDQSAGTASAVGRAFTIQGRRYSAILDPKTGWPAASPIVSVTVATADPGLAQAFAAAIAVMGVEKGMKMAGVEDLECLILEVGPKDLEAWQSGGALPAGAEIIAHRSSGMAEMEARSPDNDE